MGSIVCADNLEATAALPDGFARLIYIDPPFNTGTSQSRQRIKAVADPEGDRTGFAGKRYRSEKQSSAGYADNFTDFEAFIRPRIEAAHRLLAADGSFFFHIDYREAHYCKVWIDEIFGRDSFMNEIIWAYDYGARSKSKWSAKHDTIFWYARDPRNYVFNHDAMDRIPYMAPGLVTKEKAARGKTPTDVWWHTIVSPTGKEKTGYATQKPLGVLERIVKVHSEPGDMVLDFFAGSGTTGEAAARNGREYWLCDSNPEAVRIMRERLGEG
ncbi:site-specific DNA-methyltransferase [bacterium]|nr:MAG: site-specific DNA-methyltransferase [bacterium]